jgi:hypothetical protein
MDEEWGDELEPGDDADEYAETLLAAVAHVRFCGHHTIYLDGVRITPLNCPDCLQGRAEDCGRCLFFQPEVCSLRNDQWLVEDLTSILAEYREDYRRWMRRRRALLAAMCGELNAHGRPLHYTVLAQMIAHRHPRLQASETSVLHMLAEHSEKFEKVGEGVYWLAA